MGKRTAEEIINKLREVEVIIAAGSSVVEAVRSNGVSERTLYRRRMGASIQALWFPFGTGLFNKRAFLGHPRVDFRSA